MNKKTSMAALLAVGSSVIASVALAGFRTNVPVNINLAVRRAEGALGTVHNTADNRQFIGCQTQANSAGGVNGTCTARDLAGTTVRCSSAVPAIIAVMQSLSGDSYLVFNWNPDGSCRAVSVQNASQFEPKRH